MNISIKIIQFIFVLAFLDKQILTLTGNGNLKNTILNKGDLYVSNNLEIKNLEIINKNFENYCERITGNQFIINKSVSEIAEGQRIKIDKIIPKNKDFIQVYGQIDVQGFVNLQQNPKQKIKNQKGSVLNSSQQQKKNLKIPIKQGRFMQESSENSDDISFLQTSQIYLNGVKQWANIDSQSFDLTNLKELQEQGWQLENIEGKNNSFIKNSEYDSLNQIFDQDQALTGSINQEISKNYENLNQHRHIKIEGNFYFISEFWNGQAAYIKLDNKIVWLDHHDWQQKNDEEQECENFTKINDYYWQRPINFVVNHRRNSLKVTFGTNINQRNLNHKCVKLLLRNNYPLFAIDDFHISIK